MQSFPDIGGRDWTRGNRIGNIRGDMFSMIRAGRNNRPSRAVLFDNIGHGQISVHWIYDRASCSIPNKPFSLQLFQNKIINRMLSITRFK